MQLTSVAVLLSIAAVAVALNNGVALKPILGWNTWEKYYCNINETLIRDSADAMVSTGLLAAGYNYLNIDDCWAGYRDDKGYIHPDNKTFPSGIKSLADYVHSKGLKFGIYSDAGVKTCAGRPGSLGFEKQDAESYASWGVDLVKYDNCYATAAQPPVPRYEAMRDALNQTGRPMVFSLCDWGVDSPWQWGARVGNMWRVDDDGQDGWDSLLRCIDNTAGLSKFAGKGRGWNDPDLLQVGNGGMNYNEYHAQFALWALVKSPLIISTDIMRMSDDTRKILFAKELIAINQDELGVPGDLVRFEGPEQTWAGPLADGSRAVVLFNRYTRGSPYPTNNLTVDFVDLGYSAHSRCTVRDLYLEQDLGEFTGTFTTPVPLHGVAALKIRSLEESENDVNWRPVMRKH